VKSLLLILQMKLVAEALGDNIRWVEASC